MTRSEHHKELVSRAQCESERFDYYGMARQHMEFLWDLVARPIQFPARELPKAA